MQESVVHEVAKRYPSSLLENLSFENGTGWSKSVGSASWTYRGLDNDPCLLVDV